MTKSAQKKAASAKASNTTNPAAINPAPSAGTSQPLVLAQPASKQQAAKQAGMFLYTDDSWSSRYWDSNDLHYLEREVFG